MKKILIYLGIAAMALSIAACEEKPVVPDVNNITEDGFYVALDPTGATAVTEKEMMANGINEAADQSLRDGMYEKYIVLEANKEFSLAYITGGKMTLYGANLTEFKPEELTGIYDSNPADAVFKGKLEIGENAPKMKVSKKGLYHIVLDLNKKNDLDNAQIVLCPVTMGVRGGMNSWGFTELQATEPSNEGITFTLSGQKLADGGEFKFAYNNAWKITLDAEGAVKANTNLGKDCKPGGDNIAVTEGAGAYKITLNFKLAAGDIAKSFSYSIEQESKSETPTTMFMIGQQFGAWDWNSDGVVELVPVWGKEGAFWCTRFFSADGFKFCALREWNGDFTGLGSDEGYTVADGNCFVPAPGMYTVYINLLDKVLEIKPAEVYGLGDAVFTGGWDFDTAQKAEVEDGKFVITTAGAGELRLASKVIPTVKVEGCGDFGWFDWWKTEFIFFADGKIVYRGAGNDQERVQIEAGKKIVLDFNAGTAEIKDGMAPEAAAFLAWLANPTTDYTLTSDIDITGAELPRTNVSGNLNGAGHTVTYSLKYEGELTTAENPETVNWGLLTTVSGTVKDLKVAGSILMCPAADITNKDANNNTIGFGVGGVAGRVLEGGKIENCESSVEILANTKNTYYIGGIAGVLMEGATVTGSTNKGPVMFKLADYASGNACQLGGIVGQANVTGSIVGCVNDGEVYYSALGTARIGGIIGYINNMTDYTIKDCTNNGELTSDFHWSSGYTYIAGISGYFGTPAADGKILYDNCVNNGTVKTISPAEGCARVGGIAAYGGNSNNPANGNELYFKNCKSNGHLINGGATSKKGPVGGIAAMGEKSAKFIFDGCVVNCICETESNYSGGLIGQTGGTASEIVDCVIGANTVIKAKTISNVLAVGLLGGSNAKFTPAISAKIQGGSIDVDGTATAATADNFAGLLFGAAVSGSTEGVTFGN